MIRDMLRRKSLAGVAPAASAVVALVALLSLFILGVSGIPGTSAGSLPGPALPTELHGIGFVKGCNSPTTVGQPYVCTYQAINAVDTQHDTLTITSVVDVVHAGSGDATSANLLPTATLTLGGGAFCNGGQTLCTLPFGASVQFSATFYTVQADDPNPLTDTATLTFQDTCSPGTPTANCPLGQTLHSTAASQSEVQTNTPTPTDTATPTPTDTATPTPTDTATPTPTDTATPTPTDTATPTPTNTPTPTATSTNTSTPEATNTPHHHERDTPTPVPSSTPVPRTATPVSQVSPVVVTPASTPFPAAQFLPSTGGGSSGNGATATIAGAVVLLLAGGALLSRRRLLRDQR